MSVSWSMECLMSGAFDTISYPVDTPTDSDSDLWQNTRVVCFKCFINTFQMLNTLVGQILQKVSEAACREKRRKKDLVCSSTAIRINFANPPHPPPIS